MSIEINNPSVLTKNDSIKTIDPKLMVTSYKKPSSFA